MKGGRNDIRQRGVRHTSTRPTRSTRVGSPCGKITGITARPGSGSRPVPPKNRNMFHQSIMTYLLLCIPCRVHTQLHSIHFCILGYVCTLYNALFYPLYLLYLVHRTMRWAKKRQRNNPEGLCWATIGWEWLGGPTCLMPTFT